MNRALAPEESDLERSPPAARKPSLVRRLGLCALAAIAMPAARAALAPEDILTKLAPAAIEARLPDEPPSNYYLYAGRLLKAGDFPGALRWFYIGQLRYRVYLQAHPGEDSSLFGALNQSLGTPLNRYGALHKDEWLAAIDAALAWDATHANAYTAKDTFAVLYTAQRAGLTKLKGTIASRADELQAAASGREPMPADWPALVPITTAKELEGVFGRWDSGSVTSIFFKVQPAGINWMMSVELELRAVSADRLLVIARGKQGELARAELAVTFQDGAACFSLPDTVGQNPRGGGSSGTARLRRNAAQDLVVERDVLIEESHNVGVPVSTEPHRFWKRAPFKAIPPGSDPAAH